MASKPSLRFQLSAAIIRVASWFVPRERRRAWCREWEAELVHRWQRRRAPAGNEPITRSMVFWSLGAFNHAWFTFKTEFTMDIFWQDFKYGFRSLRNGPGLIAVAVLSLGLGIGANATIFSAVDVFMLRPLPYPESDRLLAIYATNEERGWTQLDASAPDYIDFRNQSQTMEITAYNGANFNLAGDGTPERLLGAVVSPHFFNVVGIQPAQGRTFRSEEEAPGNGNVVVIGDGLWHRRFGAEANVVGRDVLLDGTRYTVVGVMPPKFWFNDPNVEIWAPLTITGEEPRNSHFLDLHARIRDGFSIELADQELQTMARQIAETYPETSAGNGARLTSLHDDLFSEEFRMGSLISSVAVAFVLLIACANVANLLLTRAAGRMREVALRGALGAGRLRIVRQFLSESLIVAAMGGLLGIGLAFVGIRGLVSWMPPWFPRVDEIALDGRVLLYTAAISLVTGVIFGIAPALQSSKPNLTDTLKEGGRGGTGTRGHRLRRVLVVGELSLALVLLVSSALLVQGFAKIRLADLGFDETDVYSIRTTLSEAEYPDSLSVRQSWETLSARFASLPGVTSVGATTSLPLRGGSGTYYSVPGEQSETGRRPVTGFRSVYPGYFEAMDIPLLRGRTFEDRDRGGMQRTLVINEAFAERHWPDTDPIGQFVEFATGPREIIGVVGNTLDDGAQFPPDPTVFFSVLQDTRRSVTWVIESAGDLTALGGALRNAVSEVDPNLPVYDVMTLQASSDEMLGGDTIMAKIMAVLAGIALVLAIGGVYGVMAYTVSQRSQELGIRMALGARASDVVSLVIKQGTVLGLLGVVVGIVLGAGVTRGLSTFLFGVSPFDPVTFGAVAVILFSAALAASYFPARKATAVDPVAALRND